MAGTALPSVPEERRGVMLWALIVILLVLWLLGLIGSVGGAFINLLLVVAFRRRTSRGGEILLGFRFESTGSEIAS